MKLFGRSRRRVLTVRLTARVEPMQRGELYEDPLDAFLRQSPLNASVDGGGTMLSPDGEVEFCDLEIACRGDDGNAVAAAVVSHLESLGAPKGSSISDQDGRVIATFGTLDGLGLYLNGTDLPDEVYANSDTNELAAAVDAALGETGQRLSEWHGPTETALYLYGPDADAMRVQLQPLLTSRPDMQLSRLVPLT